MVLGIIQARMGSTRLPGKVLKIVNGEPLIKILYNRLQPSEKVDEFVVATTNNQEDDELFNYCNSNNIKCYRGSDWDVLARFYNVAESYSPETIVRICADNPLHSYKVVDFVVDEYQKSGKEYFSNSNQEPDYLEDGFDVEVFSFKALALAYQNADLMSEREHVCPYIKKHFSCGWKKTNEQYSYKLSVDTQADLDAVSEIFAELGVNSEFSIDDVVSLLTRKPEILQLNKNSTINSGFQKSLKEDKKVK